MAYDRVDDVDAVAQVVAAEPEEPQADLDHEDGEQDEVAVPHRLVPGGRLAVPRRRVPAQYQGQGRGRGRGRVGVGVGVDRGWGRGRS